MSPMAVHFNVLDLWAQLQKLLHFCPLVILRYSLPYCTEVLQEMIA